MSYQMTNKMSNLTDQDIEDENSEDVTKIVAGLEELMDTMDTELMNMEERILKLIISQKLIEM